MRCMKKSTTLLVNCLLLQCDLYVHQTIKLILYLKDPAQDNSCIHNDLVPSDFVDKPILQHTNPFQRVAILLRDLPLLPPPLSFYTAWAKCAQNAMWLRLCTLCLPVQHCNEQVSSMLAVFSENLQERLFS